ncbi:stage II sporulation protein M [Ectobacillus panaciterrae]|uniref:stage II sporulation protein M n=1 Tax=Ectobacillus panaciterrae TaxID=363872 RepID=UPI00048E2CE1|nr:stage II sporulation protein M [Ectobacillus panaciterrae]
MVRKSWQDRAACHIQENSSLYLFVSVLLLMGVIFGAVLVNSLQASQKQDLYFYLSRFFGQVSQGKFASSGEMFQESYFSHLKYIGLIWLLGISVIGLPIIFILLFLKGVVVGFTVGFLVNQLGWNGFLLSFAAVLPQNLIIIPVFLVMTMAAASFSLRMIRHQFVRRMHEPLLPLFVRYTCFFLVIGLALALASGIESYISPALMKSIVEAINKK